MIKRKFKKIGFVGTGIMGNPMCSHLLKSKYEIYLFNRSKEKAQNLVELGAHWCSNPKEVALRSELIITIVGYPKDVKNVYFGSDGIFEGIKPNSILVDMTTSEPRLAQEIFKKAEEKNVFSLDAPVSGGQKGAIGGNLAIMVGGSRDIFDLVLPIFEILGENIAYMGNAGTGQHTKMSNQILIASTMVGVIESLLYGYKAGINLDEIIDVIGKGAAASWSINNLGRQIASKNFDPGFYIKHFIKDMGIALQEAKNMNLSLPGLSLVYQFYIAAKAMGFKNLGTQGLYKVFERMNNI
ncbi:NAD(P)-dependent oxidoreductase [Promethearchaeum syntrophicum]|uniref:NAD(P)-dependent oxidoreductase n=1 Tax=Promethearchaeum syntrophicum TaxID=2594042 RepID=A0A5B9DDY4_9ARCH|nr:NAD(P)-dependent oxidoreductase [Candidatus Prometheoarchaeum syntrophicum]QEE17000.1 tartronate semialdehyde reductase [Candidatus Prometheoarchaeum syntrophicum]